MKIMKQVKNEESKSKYEGRKNARQTGRRTDRQTDRQTDRHKGSRQVVGNCGTC